MKFKLWALELRLVLLPGPLSPRAPAASSRLHSPERPDQENRRHGLIFALLALAGLEPYAAASRSLAPAQAASPIAVVPLSAKPPVHLPATAQTD